MENKFKLGQRVVINTGGLDTIAHIDTPIKDIHGHYWKEMDCYLCRFTDNPDKLLCNGAEILQGYEMKKGVTYVVKNAQYIPSQYLKPF